MEDQRVSLASMSQSYQGEPTERTTKIGRALEWLYPGKEKVQRGDLRSAIIDYVAGFEWVTFVELKRCLAPYMEVEGDGRLCLGNDPNLIVWANVSEVFAGLVTGLLEDGLLVCEPASWLAYLMDGGTLRLPLAKRPPKNGYESSHWLPVCLRTAERSAP